MCSCVRVLIEPRTVPNIEHPMFWAAPNTNRTSNMVRGVRLALENFIVSSTYQAPVVPVAENTKEQPCQVRGRPFQKGIKRQSRWTPKSARRRAGARSRKIARSDQYSCGKSCDDEKAPPAARVAAANSLLDRGYGKPTQPISQTLTKIDPSTMSDEELAAIVRNGIQADDRPH